MVILPASPTLVRALAVALRITMMYTYGINNHITGIAGELLYGGVPHHPRADLSAPTIGFGVNVDHRPLRTRQRCARPGGVLEVTLLSLLMLRSLNEMR